MGTKLFDISGHNDYTTFIHDGQRNKRFGLHQLCRFVEDDMSKVAFSDTDTK